jgi:GcrA cell cycle regulator
MSRWTAEEIRELVTLWPTNSAMQIANRMHRPRAAICGKAKRLLKEGLLAGKIANPRKRRPRRASPPQLIMPPKPPPPVDDRLAMQPCSILELDAGRCHWPLGEVHKVATEFCGGTPAPGHRYCRHHLRMAH